MSRLSSVDQSIARDIAARLVATDRLILFTDRSGERWLTDTYVMLKATGAVGPVHANRLTDELPDGWYRLTMSRGFEPTEGFPTTSHVAACHLEDLEAREANGRLVTPTGWLYADGGDPVALWERHDEERAVGVGVNARVTDAWRPLLSPEKAGEGAVLATQTADERPIRLRMRPRDTGSYLDPDQQSGRAPSARRRTNETAISPPSVTVAWVMPIRTLWPAAPASLSRSEQSEGIAA